MPYDTVHLEHGVLSIELFAVLIERNIEIEAKSGVYEIISTVKRGIKLSNGQRFFSDFLVSKNSDDTMGPCFMASYALILGKNAQTDEFPNDDYLQLIAATVTWQRFATLFHNVIGQTSLDFPPLPLLPPTARFVDLNPPSAV